jgi:threonine dehydratase|eukprot:CAMPEP_0174315108 /NCGR_PEP_ID=MMETSP0810-20121108/6073_1 /TAXON_ID=73025 ORGANISM="Eutreptiella gymnastica-like, Strain CCMP1594" /NCGR_SAMPLE_ID=MMETSP0810 /ASSEMBLY_ACC=CAM_ASM_000659 /LENGTH=425 /DNA_ID=CAMNT_0015424397 /DNA_START=20 /DNA_END=1297 /DNA_ORIENTATION=+
MGTPAATDLRPNGLACDFSDIVLAHHRIQSGIVETPVRHSAVLSELTGGDVWLKLEHLQQSGSFKERGARNALMNLTDEEKAIGVIAASAGNHALAMAYHGRDLGIPVAVVMPTTAPLTKVNNCRKYGANVMLHGNHIGEAYEHAVEIVKEKGYTYINGFDHPNIVAGAGTCGIEMIRQVPGADYIVVPVGGGGLIAGIAMSAKALCPSIQIIGVEPENAASLTAALAAGKPVKANVKPTLADGLAVPMVGANSFEIIRKYVDKVVLISEDDVARAVLNLMESQKMVVEGGGAVGVAAILSGKLPELQGKKVIVPLCGGNIDAPVIGRVIQRGLAHECRLVRFSVIVDDKPGGLAGIALAIAQAGANVIDVRHERAWLRQSFAKVQNNYIIEVRNQEHMEEVRSALTDAGYQMEWDIPMKQAAKL